MLEGDINIEIPEDVPKIPLNSTPSVNDNGETALKRLCEAEGYKEDICNGGIDSMLNECDIRKRLLWCNTHECGVKIVKESTKKWQWNKSKMKFMWMYKSVNKYSCPSMRSSRVQPMVSEAKGEKQTKPEPIESFGSCNEGLENYYVGQNVRGLER